MSRTTLLRLLAPAALAAATLAWIAPSTALVRIGPPWISIESPPNPHDRETRDAALVVRTYHHGTQLDQGVRGTAEGMVGTDRKTLTLRFDRTSQPGVYALRRQWPDEGRWALVISTGPADGAATALVGLDARGAVASVQVPSRRSADGWSVPRAVTRAEVDALLRTAEVARAGR
jgi:hypothetical protein